jgi:ribonuclease P protein component
VVAHLQVTDGSGGSKPRVGFVVGRGVGNAVVRNQVRRRLRQLLSDRVPQLPAASLLVVRATPVASERSWAQLAVDVDDALESVTR